MRGGAIHDRTTFVILCNVSMKRNGQHATTDTLAYTYTFSTGKQRLTYIRRQINSSHANQLSAAIYSVSQSTE